MHNFLKSHTDFHRSIARFMIIMFLFSTCFPGMPGSPTIAHADEVTYIAEYSYDKNGNVKSRKTPDGDTIEYEYDSLNRLIAITYPDESAISYEYDADDNRLEMTDSHGTTYYSYDRLNRLTGVQISSLNPTYYEYDKAGNLSKIKYPTGEEIIYAYDGDNRLISVTDLTGVVSYEYENLSNNLIKKSLPNGVFTVYTYDTAKRITDVINKKSDQTLISSYHYEFDANNNRTLVIQTTPAGTKTTNYTYDKLNRLLSATCSDGTYEIYTYDESGNRLTKETQTGTITYEYDLDNRLLSAGNTIFFL